MNSDDLSKPYERARETMSSVLEKVKTILYYKSLICEQTEAEEDENIERAWRYKARKAEKELPEDCASLAELAESLVPNEKQQLIAMLGELKEKRGTNYAGKLLDIIYYGKTKLLEKLLRETLNS